ncbi:MAG: HNH endonuclease [Rubrivivax sp.]|nr:MAG: HNH endonuclease [Rubrivivax sp.]
MSRLALLLGLAVALASPAHAWPGRSAQAVTEFRKANPCPATGRVSGPCRGWEVDHREPLKCGGLDAPANMQWLTVHEHKLKTKREAKFCRRRVVE